jgi:hypothetical protein
MSIEIGHGLKPEERNRHVKKALEYLKKEGLDLFGTDVELVAKYAGTLAPGNRTRRGRVTFEGIFVNEASYNNFSDDVKKLNDQIKSNPGFMTMSYHLCKISGRRYFPMDHHQEKTFPLQVRTVLNLISANDIEYFETWHKFEKSAAYLARKYKLHCSKKYFGKA